MKRRLINIEKIHINEDNCNQLWIFLIFIAAIGVLMAQFPGQAGFFIETILLYLNIVAILIISLLILLSGILIGIKIKKYKTGKNMKRFIQKDFFQDGFIRSLPAHLKLLWVFLFTQCSNAGVWEVDFQLASMLIGKKVNRDCLKIFNDGKERIFEIREGKCWVLNGFIKFQYSNFDPKNIKNPFWKNINSDLQKYGLMYDSVSGQTLPRVYVDPQCKYKEKDKDKYKEKEKKDNPINRIKETLEGSLKLKCVLVTNITQTKEMVKKYGIDIIIAAILRWNDYYIRIEEKKLKYYKISKNWGKFLKYLDRFIDDENFSDFLKEVEGWNIGEKKKIQSQNPDPVTVDRIEDPEEKMTKEEKIENIKKQIEAINKSPHLQKPESEMDKNAWTWHTQTVKKKKELEDELKELEGKNE